MRVLASTATFVRKFAVAIILSGFAATLVFDSTWSQAATGGGSSSTGGGGSSSTGGGGSPGGNSPPPSQSPTHKMAIRSCDAAPCPPKPKKHHRKIVHHTGCRVVRRVLHTSHGTKIVRIRHCRRH